MAEVAKTAGWALLLAIVVMLAAAVAYGGYVLWHLATKGGL